MLWILFPFHAVAVAMAVPVASGQRAADRAEPETLACLQKSSCRVKISIKTFGPDKQKGPGSYLPPQ